jgi:hypothetical protein
VGQGNALTRLTLWAARILESPVRRWSSDRGELNRVARLSQLFIRAPTIEKGVTLVHMILGVWAISLALSTIRSTKS